MIKLLLLVGAIWYFSRKTPTQTVENPAAAVPVDETEPVTTDVLPVEESPAVTTTAEIEKVENIHLPDLGVIIKTTGPVLTGSEVARLPDGSLQPVTEMPVSNQEAPFPAGTVVDIPSMEPLFCGYFVAPDGTWQTNTRLFTAHNPDDNLVMMRIGGGGFITLDDGRVVPL